MEAKSAVLLGLERSQTNQTPANRGLYSQVGFSYNGGVKDENQDSDNDDGEDEDDFNSDDSNDEAMDIIAKEFGIKRYGWLVYMDKKGKEEERRQKETNRLNRYRHGSRSRSFSRSPPRRYRRNRNHF